MFVSKTTKKEKIMSQIGSQTKVGGLVNTIKVTKRKYCPTKFINGKQVKISRLVMSSHLNRPLLSSELVHHRNENIVDNRIENLQVVSRSEHKKIHHEVGEKTRFKEKYKIPEKVLLELYKQMTIDKIAKKLCVSFTTIYLRIKKFGIRNKIECKFCGKNPVEYIRSQMCNRCYHRCYLRCYRNQKNTKLKT